MHECAKELTSLSASSTADFESKFLSAELGVHEMSCAPLPKNSTNTKHRSVAPCFSSSLETKACLKRSS